MEQLGEDLDFAFLLEHERDMILKVLQKDEKLRKREEKRIRRLKNELLEMKHKGFHRPQEVGERQCARCLKALGLIFGRGDLCTECQLRICNDCSIKLPNTYQWKCNVCAKISELKVATGEWFLEERSKRFEQGVPSSDAIKQTIMSIPYSAENKSTENLSVASDLEATDTPKSKRSAIRSVVDGARRRGDSSGLLESSGMPTVINNVRSTTPDRLSSCSDTRRVRVSGTSTNWQHTGKKVLFKELRMVKKCVFFVFVCSLMEQKVSPAYTPATLQSDKRAASHHTHNSGTPTISVSRASGSSDHSRSEVDLLGPGSEHSDDTLSLRSRSVPGFNETEFSDEEEDIDALISAHNKTDDRHLSSALSTSSINSMMSMYSDTGDYGNARVKW
ncbi:hypothetical protein fugu_001352 [Takifugu bimaculatus]|uniref:RabBD domain-containing protein n=1 Tax=Takifugu bimaculatus TaxID=433685 RepID=A0A4Z2CJ91_9TELE|nr:hypothetical protein fugu_001352 [Takifugu bimaculatus]